MLSQHLPALKVGGRRLSLSAKAKPAAETETQAVHATPEVPVAQEGTESSQDATDYPRPTPASQLNDLTEEENDRKNQGYMDAQEREKRKQPAAQTNHKKHVDTAKAANAGTSRKDQGARISQPPGRGLEF